MRKAKKSMHVEAVALSLFIVALVGYASFFSVGSNVNAETNVDAAANKQCEDSWNKFKQIGEERKRQGSKEDPEAYADRTNKAQGKCGASSTGGCDFGETPKTKNATICRGDKDKHGNKASDEGKKKAEDAMKKKEEPKGEGKGGGEPPKMPEMPKKEPKKEEPKQEQKPCAPQQPTFGRGEQTTVLAANNPLSGQQQFDQYGRPCPTENAPANFLSQLRDSLLKAFSETFTPLTNSDLEGLTPEEQLQKISDLINGNPTIADSEKPARIVATDKLVTEYEKGGYKGTIEKAVAHANLKTVDQINNTATDVDDDLRTLAQSQSADLISTTGSINTNINPESSTNIVTSVTNWLKSWFGF